MSVLKISPNIFKGKKSEIEVKEFFSRFSNDVIARVAFGIRVNSLEDPENDFYLIGKTVTSFRVVQILKLILAKILPILAKVANDFVYTQ